MHMPRNQAQGHEPINIIERSSGWWIAGDNPEGPFDTYEDAAASLTDPAVEHTPGPWVWNKPHPYGAQVTSVHGWICQVSEQGRIPTAEEKANAALIAQAPTLKAENERLRAALRDLVQQVFPYLNDGEADEQEQAAFDTAWALAADLGLIDGITGATLTK